MLTSCICLIMKKYCTTFDISKIIDVYPTTVANWIDRGKLKAFKTPVGHRKVTKTDLLAFLKKYNMPIVTVKQKKQLIVYAPTHRCQGERRKIKIP